MRVRQQGVSSRQIGPETILLDFESSNYLRLNETGTLLYRLLGEGRQRDDLVTAMLEEYDVDAETATADVDAFLAELGGSGLLETS